MKIRYKISWIVGSILVLILIYTRFVGLDWGLPYPMHPDERNMAVAIEQLKCTAFDKECFNPHFFAYGQLPLYLSYLFVQIMHVFTGSFGNPVSFIEATMALRYLSAVASVITTLTLLKLAGLFIKRLNPWIEAGLGLLFIFSPAFIQFSHFGTTESALMMFYTLLMYLAIKLLLKHIEVKPYVLCSALVMGLALATKVSAAVFVAVPFVALVLYYFTHEESRKLLKICFWMAKFVSFSLIVFIIFSPYNVIDLQSFLGSMKYESDIGLGRYVAFYTRQFQQTIPVVFQFTKIFPYVLGLPVLLSFIAGYILLPWKKEYILLRLAFLVYFLPNAFFFAKWTRFMAPIFPVMLLIAGLFLVQVFEKVKDLKIKNVVVNIGFTFIMLYFSLPGMAYLSIYTTPDIRFRASEWIVNNIRPGSKILSETANVVDLPIFPPNSSIPMTNYAYISFNHYDVDENPMLAEELDRYISEADYIFVPSRRVFWNHACQSPSNWGYNHWSASPECQKLEDKYPKLRKYYYELFSGKSGFKKVAEFRQNPKIELFGFTFYEIQDEAAEETWTVFDHPVIRIYRKTYSK